MKLSHLVPLLSSIALLAWARPAPVRPQEPRGQLELRYDLLSLNFVRPGSSQAKVVERFGKPTYVEHLAEGCEIWTLQTEDGLTTVYLGKGRVVGICGFGQSACLNGYETRTRTGIREIFGPPHQETRDTYTYSAGHRTVTFLFGSFEQLQKTTLSEIP